MLKRIQRRWGATEASDAAARPAWQEVLRQEAKRPAATGLITPPPPDACEAQAPHEARTWVSQGDHFAHSGQFAAARRAYASEAKTSPLDPFPVMQLIRLVARDGHQQEEEALRRSLEARAPDPFSRAQLWLSLYAPRRRLNQRYGEASLAALLRLSQLGELDAEKVRLLLSGPTSDGQSLLTLATAHASWLDVKALLALDASHRVFGAEALLGSLASAVSRNDYRMCVALAGHVDTPVPMLPPQVLEHLLDSSMRHPDDELQQIIARRGLHPTRALDVALSLHGTARIRAVAELTGWRGQDVGPVVSSALQHTESERVMEILLDAGLPLDRPLGDASCAPLLAAIEADRPAVVRRLIARGADPGIMHPQRKVCAIELATPVCATELLYPDRLMELCAFLEGYVVSEAPQSRPRELESWARRLRPDTIESCRRLLASLFAGHVHEQKAEELLRQVAQLQEKLAVPAVNELALGWVEPWATLATRHRAFALLVATPTPDWAAGIDSACRLLHAACKGSGPHDAWFEAHRGTLGLLFKTLGATRHAQGLSLLRAWPVDYLLWLESRFGPLDSDVQRVRLLRLALAFMDARLAPGAYQHELRTDPMTAMRFLHSLVPSDYRRRVAATREEWEAPSEHRRPETGFRLASMFGPANPGPQRAPPRPRPPTAHFPYLTEAGRKATLTELVAFLDACANEDARPLADTHELQLCNQAESLVADEGLQDEIWRSSDHGAHAYLQLLQSVMGPEKMAEVFATDGVNVKPLIQIQRRTHPDKPGGKLELSRLLNGVVRALRREGLGGRLHSVYGASAKSRAAFYAGVSLTAVHR